MPLAARTELLPLPIFEVKIAFAAPAVVVLLVVAAKPAPAYWPASSVQPSPEAGFEARNDCSVGDAAIVWLMPASEVFITAPATKLPGGSTLSMLLPPPKPTTPF